MKKRVILGTALLLCFAAAGFCKKTESDEPPAGAEGTLLDTKSLKGKISDNIRLISGIEEKKSFIVFFYNSKKELWQPFGSAELLRYADTAFIDSKVSVDRYRWYSIKAEDGKEYRYEISAKHNDLYINIWSINDSENINKEKAEIIDASSLSGKFKDNVKLVNNTTETNLSFTVYGFNDKNEKWTKIGNTFLKNIGDDSIAMSPVENIAQFKFFGIISNDGKSFNYSATKAHNDLIIILADK